MNLPRRWVVWLVVVIGVQLPPSEAGALPNPARALPRNPCREVCGDPDVPVNPGPSAGLRLPRLRLAIVRTTGLEWVSVTVANYFLQLAHERDTKCSGPPRIP